MKPEEDGVLGWIVEFTDDEIRLLLHTVSEAIRLWPGYPARPIKEQENLYDLKNQLFKLTLEMLFEQQD